jgi:hypothetical protein
MTSVDSIHGQLSAQYGREYASMSKRSYTVEGVTSPSGGTFRVERR